MKKLFILFLLASSYLIAVDPFFPGGQLATPEIYKIYFSKLEFGDANNNFVTFMEGSVAMDIASVNPFQAVGTVGQGSSLPPGTYTKMRFTVSKIFGVKATVNQEGVLVACTNAGNPSSTMTGYETMGAVANATESSITSTQQEIDVPIDPAHMPPDETLSGTNIIGTKTIPTFTIPATGKVVIPFRMNFNVTDSVEFVKIAGTVFVFTHPPVVTFE